MFNKLGGMMQMGFMANPWVAAGMQMFGLLQGRGNQQVASRQAMDPFAQGPFGRQTQGSMFDDAFTANAIANDSLGKVLSQGQFTGGMDWQKMGIGSSLNALGDGLRFRGLGDASSIFEKLASVAFGEANLNDNVGSPFNEFELGVLMNQAQGLLKSGLLSPSESSVLEKGIGLLGERIGRGHDGAASMIPPGFGWGVGPFG